MILHFRTLGEGPPLILLHGLLGSLDNWLPPGRKFAALTDAERPFPNPALFHRGGQSTYVSERDLALIRRLFPQAQMRTIPGAGHWVHADAPEEFARIVLEFLIAC